MQSKNLLEKIDENVNEIKLDIAEMKVDVRHHIKRSDAHEDNIIRLVKFKERVMGGVALITFISTLITIYMVFKKD